jgi:hypothetical protein
MGNTGMMKKSVTNLIPFLPVKTPTVPHCAQRIVCPVGSDPQVMKRVPMTKMKKSIELFQRFAARAFFAAPAAFFFESPPAVFFFEASAAFACGFRAASRRADASRAAGDWS